MTRAGGGRERGLGGGKDGIGFRKRDRIRAAPQNGTYQSGPFTGSDFPFFPIRQPGFVNMQPPDFRNRSIQPRSGEQALIHEDRAARYGHV
jgi:hypothetical protein